MNIIQTATVGSGGAASIVFSGIPQGYTDLVVLLSVRNSVDSNTGTIAFNTGGSYTRKRITGNGTTASSDNSSPDFQSNTSVSTANVFSSGTIYIPNYTGSTVKNYSVDSVNENNATLANASILSGQWSETAAITSITLAPSSGNFVEFSSASLYGITKGSDGITTAS